MIEVGLFDGSFKLQQSATLGGENAGLGSKYIKWVRNNYRDVTVFTDMHIRNDEHQANAKRKVAWIIEPDWLMNGDNAEVALSKFDTVFTSDMAFVSKYWPTFQYVPIGGSWIDEDSWGIPVKDALSLTSMMTTDKQKAPGHKMRHLIVDQLKNERLPVFLYGRGSFPIGSKFTALNSYMYSIVVESYSIPGYFSEKLIDCLSQGTIPIYWGDPEIARRFVKESILSFNSVDELLHILWRLGSPGKCESGTIRSQGFDFYQDQRDNIEINLELARRYRCAEDWAFEAYPNEFT